MGQKLKGKKNSLIHKTWERCRSLGNNSGSHKIISATPTSSPRSWPCSPVSLEESTRKNKGRTVPDGCFSVYVGADKQRFIVKTARINHPLFKMLLEEAEMEYGYNCDGPLVLPCDVNVFYDVLSEMEGDEIRQGCTFAKGYGSYRLVGTS
ncbi:hypothetical protein ACHQM5_025057 [Ranunculus cassubicifolius]